MIEQPPNKHQAIANAIVTIAAMAIVAFSCWAAYYKPASPSALERQVADLEVELGEVSQEVVNLHQQVNDLQACARGCE